MPTTLKNILDAVMGESGFLIPASYAASLNPDDLQLVYLSSAASDELRDLDLTQSRVQGSITLTSATDYALPDDFFSYVADTAFQGTIPVDLPTSPSDWAWVKSYGAGSPSYRVRFMGGRLHVMNPTAGDVIQFEYITSLPWEASGVGKEKATADTDIWRLDRRLLQYAVKWRWKKEKGVEDWKDDLAMFQAYVSKLRARDSGAKTIRFGECEYPDQPYTKLWV